MAMAAAAAPSNSQMPKLPFTSPPSGGDLLKIQMGGAKFQQQVLDWTRQSNHLYLTVLFVIIFMWAVYSEKIHVQYRWQLNTTLGRLLMLIVLHIVFLLGGWIPALLFAIAIAMTWANRPLYKPLKEGFGSGNRPSLTPSFGNSRIEGFASGAERQGQGTNASEGFFGDNIKVTDADPQVWFVELGLV